MRALISLLLTAFAAGAAVAGEIPKGPFTQNECVVCHERETPDLVAAWRAGPHAKHTKPAGCVSCHGDRHAGSMSRVRKNSTCITCHGGAESTVARSYFTSKHGVIAKLEGNSWDWSKPLADANYRTPTCAYCHMHEAGHGLTAGDDAVFTSCVDCHAPRYADTIFAAGKRALEIGALKVLEAAAVIRSLDAGAGGLSAQRNALRAMFSRMRDQTLANLRLGLGHHSPDYQWWYGQAALDGDLIRIKAFITRLKREKRASDAATPPSGSSP